MIRANSLAASGTILGATRRKLGHSLLWIGHDAF